MNRRTRGLAAGVAALGAGAILLGPLTAFAQPDEPDEPTTTAPDEVEAPDDPDVGSWLQDALAPLVESGALTQAQVDAVIETLEEARPVFAGRGGPGRHWRGPGHVVARHSLSTAAEAIGITEDELRDALRDGRTIAEVAEANDVEPQAVIDALVAEATERLDDAVADGRIDEADADERRAELTERITELVNEGTLPGGPDELPRRGGEWREHRRGHDTDDTDDTDDTEDADDDTDDTEQAPDDTAADDAPTTTEG
jgi:hypothetical protein